MLGAAIGSKLSSSWNTDQDLTAIVFGFLFFGLSLLLVRMKARSLGEKREYLPRIVKIVLGGDHGLE
jgi:hypothetical protein